MSGERERRKEKIRERNFSLRSTEIGPWVFIGAIGKVGPHNEGYACDQNLRVSSNSKR